MTLNEHDLEDLGRLDAYEDILVGCLLELEKIAAQGPENMRTFRAIRTLDTLKQQRADDEGYKQAIVSIEYKLRELPEDPSSNPWHQW